MLRRFLLLSTIVFVSYAAIPLEKGSYIKSYYINGRLKSEGWSYGNQRQGYWKFYHQNGVLSKKGHYLNNEKDRYWYFYRPDGGLEKEGHYALGKMANWWIYYDDKDRVLHKCQLRAGRKNGYCLKYTNAKITSAEKYSHGKKVKEWYSLSSFKKENKLSDLR